MALSSPRPGTSATYLFRSVDSHTLTTLMTSLTVLRKSCILAATRSAGEEHDGESRVRTGSSSPVLRGGESPAWGGLGPVPGLTAGNGHVVYVTVPIPECHTLLSIQLRHGLKREEVLHHTFFLK